MVTMAFPVHNKVLYWYVNSIIMCLSCFVYECGFDVVQRLRYTTVDASKTLNRINDYNLSLSFFTFKLNVFCLVI